MGHTFKILLLIIVLFSGKTPGSSFGNELASISCSAKLPASNRSITYNILRDDPVVTSSAFSYCLKVPTLVSILTFSIGAAYYLGIFDMTAVLLPAIPGSITIDKVSAALFLGSMAYWLKEPVITALPFGTRIILHIKTAEHYFSISIRHAFKGIIFLLKGIGFAIELGLDFVIRLGLGFIGILMDKLLIALHLRQQEAGFQE